MYPSPRSSLTLRKRKPYRNMLECNHNKKLLLHASIVGHSGYEPDTLDQAELRSTFLPFGKDGVGDANEKQKS